MSTFIFCLIFIQVSIFLIAGAVIVATFYMGVTQHGREEAAAAEAGPEPGDIEPQRGFTPGEAILTRSELNFLLGI